MMWDTRHHSLAYLGRRILAVITILAIAGTLSACGRYGNPVRVAPAEVRTPAPEDGGEARAEAGTSAEVDAVDPKSKGLADDEGSDRQDEDEDEVAEELAE